MFFDERKNGNILISSGEKPKKPFHIAMLHNIIVV
jgi:hypothetical protein